MKKIALILCGNIRTFFYKNSHIAKTYMKMINNQCIDVFIYTDNNDFNYNDTQYFAENNKEKTLGITNDREKRLHTNTKFINYHDACKIIEKNLLEIFGDKLKKYHIDDYDPEQLNKIYDKNNIYHSTFMNNQFSDISRKKALMCQFYKLYKCYNSLVDYEIEHCCKYDIIFKSRFDTIIHGLNNYDLQTLDLSAKIYTNGYVKFCTDVWAIGDRFIMDKYCNYYLYISSNMVDNNYCLLINGSWNVININDMDLFLKNTDVSENASDSGEFGITYIIKYKYNYDINYGLDLTPICLKFYDKVFFEYFKNIT